ncbi:protein FAR1-RELATED SEQUENCE 5-like [Olea europaea var. sylvestris]|uniref:protein FAR1-RELATED SEQUENCE 5-like n=1 Tax=Olea europaea var. sylvestris TaxID=158386 RepID=UPI000C1D6DBE|nr:protein FAR1-RELATED SEQUENCE 5-like [Olea europaea var. sylvestris]
MGCKARISASCDILGNWRINTVHVEHNHETSPSKSRSFRCNRYLSSSVKWKLQVNAMAGISLHKSYNSAIVEVGEYENMTCIDKDCQNYVEQVRRLRLGEGDTAYKEFSNVVTFDATYLINKYDMSFAPFVGVNHHGQPTLLGCGLLSNEDTNTFVWLFRTWLQYMHDIAPHGIITDQDRAIEEFEDGWIAMIDTYGLHENDWLSRLYENRERWVLYFLKTIFWTGMSTTQKSESMNAFFDRYVHSKTSLKQFVEQYEHALRNKVEKEFQADFKEVQEEFTGKVYVSTIEGSSYTTYDVQEHAITMLNCNDVTYIPNRYILRRWRRDVIRAHTRVAVNYVGLVSSPSQLRYEEMSKAFVELGPIHCEDGSVAASENVMDPKLAQRKGVPKKLRRKSPLEMASNKAKGNEHSATSPIFHVDPNDILARLHADTTFIFTTVNAHTIISFTTFTGNKFDPCPSSTIAMYNPQGEVMPYYYQKILDQSDRGNSHFPIVEVSPSPSSRFASLDQILKLHFADEAFSTLKLESLSTATL